MSLAETEPGQTCLVTSITDTSRIRRRLQDLGIVPGTRIECIGASPLGDPTAYRIRQTVIALRREDALGVIVQEGAHV